MIVNLNDLQTVYDDEIRKNVKNKKKILEFERNKIEYLIDIKRVLENGKYSGGTYNIFLVYKPKVRVVMSSSIYDKITNHYVARYILLPKLSKYLNNYNCATRKSMGTDYAIRLLKKHIEYYKRYDNFYFLKIDISKYFYNIDHAVLLHMIKGELLEDEYKLVEKIINSTNYNYINKKIIEFERKINVELPKYNYGKGLPIGNMTSQFLAIFYLSKLQHYMIHNLHLKFVNYMDDYVILHEDKTYLKYCLNQINEKLKKEYKLDLNEKKTVISNCKIGINFLGYKFKVTNKKTCVSLAKCTKNNIKKGIKRNKYLYSNTLIPFKSLFSSIETYKYSYKFVDKAVIKNIFDKYW